MQLFYAPDITPDAPTYLFNEEESKHCIRVLRHSEGDIVHLVDGKGNLYRCTISSAHPKRCSLEVQEITRQYGRLPYRLHLAAAPTKHIERYEWMLEKCTEIGIESITPIESFHSERRSVKTDRLEKVITSAVKQSIKAYHPILHPISSFEAFINQNFGTAQLFIAHCNDSQQKVSLRDALTKAAEYVVLIGPEGDFSEQEVALARARGFQEVSLGESRLRTETAGIMVAAIVSTIHL